MACAYGCRRRGHESIRHRLWQQYHSRLSLLRRQLPPSLSWIPLLYFHCVTDDEELIPPLSSCRRYASTSISERILRPMHWMTTLNGCSLGEIRASAGPISLRTSMRIVAMPPSIKSRKRKLRTWWEGLESGERGCARRGLVDTDDVFIRCENMRPPR